MTEPQFEKADKDFAEYRREHPDADYSTWYTKRMAEKLAAGQEHNSLGRNIVTKGESNFWETGRRQAERFMKLGDVKKGDRVVEYGCGSLRLAVHFMQRLEPGAFMGLDIIPDFFQDGIENAGQDFITEQRPILETISEETIERAAGFEPDFVFAHSVIIHVHPDLLPQLFANLQAITCKPGARVAFNAMTHPEPARYGNLGWAWPGSYFEESLPELELVDMAASKKTEAKNGVEVRGATFTFVRPK